MDSDDPAEGRPKPKWRWLVILAAALLLSGALVAAFAMERRSGPAIAASGNAPVPAGSLPDTRGMTLADAEEDLRANGYAVRVVAEDGSLVDTSTAGGNRVVGQDPVSGDRAQSVSEVTVIVACDPACVPGNPGTDPQGSPGPDPTALAQCAYPRKLTTPVLTTTRVRPGERFTVSGGANGPGSPLVVVFLDKNRGSEPGPFAKYLGSDHARAAPDCEYDLELSVPSGVRPGQYHLFVMINGREPAGEPIAIEVVS